MMEPEFVPEAVRVAARLREQIIDGQRPEGSRLVERDLATELGVSRVPVREALRTLISEGLATPQPRTFTTVRTFTEADIDELIEVRSALESLAFRLCATRATAQQVDRLRNCVEREERAAREHDRTVARDASSDFHRLVVLGSGNQLLVDLYETTSARMRWLLNQHEDLGEMAREHRSLYEAVAAGDDDRAAELATAHLQTSRRAALALRRRNTAALSPVLTDDD